MTIWLGREMILAIHDEQLARHGGAGGLRDSGLLDSALARPINHAAYGEPDTAEIGAIYALAIARNHPFIDGNKRTAFMAMVLFLALNGIAFDPPEVEATMTTLTMAAGDLPDDAFIAWVRRHAIPQA